MLHAANKDKPKWPRMFFGPSDQSCVCSDESEVPKDWTDIWADAVKNDAEDGWPKAKKAAAKEHDL